MGNNDGFGSAIASMGKNKVENLDWGYFSFACGNEIALVLEDNKAMLGSSFYILNCDEDLWFNVKNEIIATNGDKKKMIKFWLDMSKKYEVSDWSENFKELKKELKRK